MAIVNAVVAVVKAIVNGIVAFFGIVVSLALLYLSKDSRQLTSTPRPTASPAARQEDAKQEQQVESSTTHLPRQRESAGEEACWAAGREVDGRLRSGSGVSSIRI